MSRYKKILVILVMVIFSDAGVLHLKKEGLVLEKLSQQKPFIQLKLHKAKE